MKENPVKKEDLLEIYADGAARGNPGPASWAFIFVSNDQIVHQKSDYIGNKTNNTAEYLAIINALIEAENYTRWEVKVFSDSQLVIRQINKEYRINAPHLSDLCSQVYNLCNKFEKVEFYHLGRNNSFIKKCDTLCNECLNAKGFEKK